MELYGYIQGGNPRNIKDRTETSKESWKGLGDWLDFDVEVKVRESDDSKVLYPGWPGGEEFLLPFHINSNVKKVRGILEGNVI